MAHPSRNSASGVIRSVRPRSISPSRSPPLTAQPALEPGHPAVIALVIIAEQVQQAVQRQHPQLGLQRMPGLPGLPARDARGNHDVAQFARLAGGKRQHVGRRVLAADIGD